jgi:hypothetical protein
MKGTKMKRSFTWLLPLFMLFGLRVINAQGHGGHGGHHNPDSLEIVTIEGYAIVDTSFMHPVYYLDEDNEQQDQMLEIL